jgi:hypothetical protein
MDIYCPRCGEPWDIDSLHDQIVERGYDYEAAKLKFPDSTERQTAYEKEWWNPIMDQFRREGCGSVFYCKCEPRRTLVTAAAQAAFEIMGDDVDGIASMMDDIV